MTLAISLFAFVLNVDCYLVSVQIIKFLNERDWRYSIMPKLLASDCIKRFKDYANYEECVRLEAFVGTLFNNIFLCTQPHQGVKAVQRFRD